jgi:hypothetical protein
MVEYGKGGMVETSESFSTPDSLLSASFSRSALFSQIEGDFDPVFPFPQPRSGKDLRHSRAAVFFDHGRVKDGRKPKP